MGDALAKSSSYLYGTDVAQWKELPYIQVLCLKIHYAKSLTYRLVRRDNMEDVRRISDVANAIKFNRGLLSELGVAPADINRTILYYTKDVK